MSALSEARVLVAVCLLVIGGFSGAGGLGIVLSLVGLPDTPWAWVLITCAPTLVGLALLADPRRPSTVESPRGGATVGVGWYWAASAAGGAPAGFMLLFFAVALGGSPNLAWLALAAAVLVGPALVAGVAAIVMSGRFRHARWPIRALIPPAAWLGTNGLVAGLAHLMA